jgi:hypothetical protein
MRGNPYEEFYMRMQHLQNVFRLAADASQHTAPRSLGLWVRTCAWWFVKGRAMLERRVRETQKGVADSIHEADSDHSIEATQPYVDLAKAWWITREIIPDYVHLERNENSNQLSDKVDAIDFSHLIQTFNAIEASMQALATSMTQNDVMPPSSILTQGMDTRIWVEYPSLPHGILCLVGGLNQTTLAKRILPGQQPFFSILVSDTQRHFNYGRLFVEAEIAMEGEPHDVQMPCVVTILREKTSSNVEITIVSQDGQINLHVQSDKRRGPTWADVEWRSRSQSICVHLTPELGLVLRFLAQEIKTLWGIFDYNRRMMKDWQPQENENVVLEEVIPIFHYSSPIGGPPESFPSKPVKDCRLRLLETSHLKVEGTGERTLYGGQRLVILTPPGLKTLSGISHALDPGLPVLFNYLRGDGNAPALMLHIRKEGKTASMIFTFAQTESRAKLHLLLSGGFINSGESASEDIALPDLLISRLTTEEAPEPAGTVVISNIEWKSLNVISSTSAAKAPCPIPLRICITCNFGVVVDRLNGGAFLPT